MGVLVNQNQISGSAGICLCLCIHGSQRVFTAHKCSRGASVRRLPLAADNNLDSLHPVGISFRTGGLPVFRPAHPADVLNMCTVVYVKESGHLAGQFYLDSLQPKRLSGCPAYLSGIVPAALPADILNMGPVLESHQRRTVSVDADSLQTKRSS